MVATPGCPRIRVTIRQGLETIRIRSSYRSGVARGVTSKGSFVRRSALALAAAALLAGCSSSSDESFDLTGWIYRPIGVPDASYCDRGEVFHVVVADQAGTIVAKGDIPGPGMFLNQVCNFKFSVRVPKRDFYRVSAEPGRPVVITLAQARAGGVLLTP